MGPDTAMDNLNSNSSTLAVPKLHNGSNWADYQPRLQNAMGAKSLWRHVKGTATASVLYAVSIELDKVIQGPQYLDDKEQLWYYLDKVIQAR